MEELKLTNGNGTKKERTRYAYSLKIARVKEEDFPYRGQELSCTSDVVSFVNSLQSADIEKMIILYMDAQNKLICLQVMSGTVNTCVVYPREVYRHALYSGACGIIIIHNHPSGRTKPSDADIHLTKTIKEVGKQLDIILHDHLIIGDKAVFSFREEGIL